jgi:hypothetical protein
VKRLDKLVERHDDNRGHLVGTVERTPRDMETRRLEFLAKSIRDLEREHRVRPSVCDEDGQIPPLSKMGLPGWFVDERSRQKDQGRDRRRGSKAHLTDLEERRIFHPLATGLFV